MTAKCTGLIEVVDITVACNREFGHGGAHQATIDDPVRDPDFTYVVSWWPTPKPEKTKAAT